MTTMQLIDEPGSSGRTTATLLASLTARLALMHAASGADAIGSLTAGLCAAGRAAATTADGRRLRDALRASRVGTNGAALWTALRLDDLAQRPPTPVLLQARNDLALLLADDLEEVLALLPIPAEAPREAVAPIDDPDVVDLIVGLWVLGRELVAAVDALAASALPPTVSVRKQTDDGPPGSGRLLR